MQVTTTYYIRGEDGAGCVDESTGLCGQITVTVNPTPPTPTISAGGSTTFCAGGSVTLTSSSASGNQWSLNGTPIGGATNQNYVATVAGNYTVIVTASGCASAASSATTVTINPIPAFTATDNLGPLCSGDNTDIDLASPTLGAVITLTNVVASDPGVTGFTLAGATFLDGNKLTDNLNSSV